MLSMSFGLMVLSGLLNLLSAQWREEDAAFALALADTVANQFQDEARGGFFFTAHNHESLIYRPKPTMDDAQPPGNGIIAVCQGWHRGPTIDQIDGPTGLGPVIREMIAGARSSFYDLDGCPAFRIGSIW